MSSKIVVPEKVLKEMHQHAVEDFPNECVGFFYGNAEDGTKEVNHYQKIVNTKDGDQKRRFEVHPVDYMKAERYALAQGFDLLGIYHSHPLHPAIPSEHDLKQAVPVFSYIIASVNETNVDNTSSWLLNEKLNKFEEELTIIKEN